MTWWQGEPTNFSVWNHRSISILWQVHSDPFCIILWSGATLCNDRMTHNIVCWFLLVDFCFSYVFMLLWLICNDPSQTWSKHLVVINFLRHAKLLRIYQNAPVEACLYRSQFSSNLTVIQRNRWLREAEIHRNSEVDALGQGTGPRFSPTWASKSATSRPAVCCFWGSYILQAAIWMRMMHYGFQCLKGFKYCRVSSVEGFQLLRGCNYWRASIIEGIELLTESNCRDSNFEGFQPLKGFNCGRAWPFGYSGKRERELQLECRSEGHFSPADFVPRFPEPLPTNPAAGSFQSGHGVRPFIPSSRSYVPASASGR